VVLTVPASKRVEQLVGATVDNRFEILAFAASGGMGSVYRARDQTNGETVAIKVVGEAGATRFAREVAVLASLDHPGVVSFVAHGQLEGGSRYLAMEWLNGEDLAERLEQGPLDVDETISVALQAGDALASAHRRGIVHRDIKPANIFLVDTRLTSVKLVDFGIARTLDDVDLTATGTVVGTPSYMAPEQVRSASADARTDVYGVGAVIFRCLTGQPPFRGAHSLAVLAKVVLEPPPLLRELCPNASAELEALVGRMLEKEPSLRPRDGAALLDELNAIRWRKPSGLPAAVSRHEQRVACVVLCAAGRAKDDSTLAEGVADDPAAAAMHAVTQRGGVIDALAKGAWVITIPNAASPAEEAMRAVRCALALAALRPTSPIFVATGRVLVGGGRKVGEVIDRAAEALVAAQEVGTDSRGVRVDASTAELLDARFRVAGAGDWQLLLGEEDAAAPLRTLLGKPAACVGREQQLAMLAAMLGSSTDESRAGSAFISAPAGLGKTHLVHTFLRRTRASRPEVDILFANGDSTREGALFDVAGEMVKRAAGILGSDTTEERATKLAALVAGEAAEDAQRLVEFLGEISGVQTSPADASPALHAARTDRVVMADAVRAAYRVWLTLRASHATVLLVVEDVHWADAASMRLLEEVLTALEDRPIFLLATGRPEAASMLSEGFRARGLVDFTLPPLSLQASERLVRGALGKEASAEVVRVLAHRAAGHPFHLEELVRAVSKGEGPDALPDSVLGMVQARLDGLGAPTRRILRAASVFGETFWSGGIELLLGEDAPDSELRPLLAKLVAEEVVSEQRPARWTGETEYRFQHAILRDGAYATLAQGDRLRAHRLAADWLVTKGETAPAVLAEHYDRGGAPERALYFHRQAAAQAVKTNDFDLALAHVERARASGAESSTEAALSALESEIFYWRGDLTAARDSASNAARQLTPGVLEWFWAVSVAIGALGQLGENERVVGWLEEAARVDAPAENRGEHVVTLCRGMTQAYWAHLGGNLAAVRTRLDTLVDSPGGIDAYESGWVHRVRGESAWLHQHDLDLCLTQLHLSCEAFQRARALRNLCLTQLNAAALTAWCGQSSRALELLGRARPEAERLGGFLQLYAQAIAGMLLAFAGDPSAETVMGRATALSDASPRLTFLGHVVVGTLALERGDVGVAEARARAASAIEVAPELRSSGLALEARIALAQGRTADALRLAREGERVEVACRDLELLHAMAGYALAAAHVACGEREAARDALSSVVRRLSRIAATLKSPSDRDRFWDRPLPNRSIRILALELGIALPE
jgi:tetratricopeptide (TPR) repeat protein